MDGMVDIIVPFVAFSIAFVSNVNLYHVRNEIAYHNANVIADYIGYGY